MSAMDLRQVLDSAGLGACVDAIAAQGIETPEDLARLAEDDIKRVAANRIQERKLERLIASLNTSSDSALTDSARHDQEGERASSNTRSLADLRQMLDSAGLGVCVDAIVAQGIESPADLVRLTEDTITSVAANRIQERKLERMIASLNSSNESMPTESTRTNQEGKAAASGARSFTAGAAATSSADSAGYSAAPRTPQAAVPELRQDPATNAVGWASATPTELAQLGMEIDVSASSLDFPHTIGPFEMGPARLADAFNAFYKQHQFPRPNPHSNENSMAGFDPSRCGLGRGDILFCQLSPLHRITLDAEAMEAANIPTTSTHFAWAYPIVQPPDAPVNFTDSAEGAFLKFGGYMYFNDRMDIVGTNAITPRPLGTLGLSFGRPQILPQSISETMTLQGRFQEITLDALTAQGATDFAWIRPGEFNDLVAAPDGAFAYKFSNGRARYFPVVGRPAYTPELFDEELDSNEAWVVVRNATVRPQIERLVIFDKNTSFIENAHSCANPIPVEEPLSNIIVTRDWAPDLRLTYDEWSQSPNRGSLVDPWIMTVERRASL